MRDTIALFVYLKRHYKEGKDESLFYIQNMEKWISATFKFRIDSDWIRGLKNSDSKNSLIVEPIAQKLIFAGCVQVEAFC